MAEQKWMKRSGCLSLGPWSLSPRAGKWGIFGAIEMFRHGVTISINREDFRAYDGFLSCEILKYFTFSN